MWSAERDLSSLITNVIFNKKFEQFQLFHDEISNKYAHFLDILKDPVRIASFLLTFVLIFKKKRFP